jgi:hypothetical protein
MVMMSQKGFQRVKVIENAGGEWLSVSEAARLLQLSERQVLRLKQRYQPDSLSAHESSKFLPTCSSQTPEELPGTTNGQGLQ